MTPGKTLVYSGTKDGEKALDLVATTRRTKLVAGVRTRVVEDRLYLDNVLAERTSDYYAQDRCGNVWYFGEDTAELDRRGKVISTEGTWHAGVDGAQPGVFMQAHPQVGRRFRQEWYQGQAEDVFKVLDRSAAVTVPYGSFRHALRTQETSALEPNVLDNKYYVKGIGEVAELSVKGPREALKLVEIISWPAILRHSASCQLCGETGRRADPYCRGRPARGGGADPGGAPARRAEVAGRSRCCSSQSPVARRGNGMTAGSWYSASRTAPNG